MKEDRYKDTNGRAETAKLSLMERVVYYAMFLLTIIAMVSLLVSLVTPHINPTYGSILPLFGLFTPVIYAANIMLVLYWVIKWEWRIVVSMLCVLALGSGSISLFVKLPLTKQYDTESYRGLTKVMSYNVKGLYDDDWLWVGDKVAAYIESVEPDIVCLQEFPGFDLEMWQRYAPKVAKYNVALHNDLIVMSRYPIVKAKNIIDLAEPDVLASSMLVDVVIRRDTIRVINNHLQSTSIKASDGDYLTSNKIVKDSGRGERLIDIASRFRANSVARATQAQSVADAISESPYALIVCGDLNDTPSSYTYTKISRGMKDSFSEMGRGYSHTYRGFFSSLRIDYILCSEERISPRSYQVDESVTYSDHLPVISHLRIDPPNI